MTSIRGTDMIRKTFTALAATGTSLFVSAAALAQEATTAAVTAMPEAAPSPAVSEATAAVATTLIISTRADEISIQAVSPLLTIVAICSTVGALISVVATDRKSVV